LQDGAMKCSHRIGTAQQQRECASDCMRADVHGHYQEEGGMFQELSLKIKTRNIKV